MQDDLTAILQPRSRLRSKDGQTVRRESLRDLHHGWSYLSQGTSMSKPQQQLEFGGKQIKACWKREGHTFDLRPGAAASMPTAHAVVPTCTPDSDTCFQLPANVNALTQTFWRVSWMGLSLSRPLLPNLKLSHRTDNKHKNSARYLSCQKQ